MEGGGNAGGGGDHGGSSSGIGDGHSSRLEGGGSDTDEDYPHNVVQHTDSSLQESFASASNTVK